MMLATPPNSGNDREIAMRFWAVVVIALLFGIFAATPPPDVNESHYLTKARQFWDPGWLPDDLFLTSGFPHWLFYATLGWTTRIVDFATAAWIGRVAGWIFLACGWIAVTRVLTWGLGRSALSAAIFAGVSSAWNLSGEWIVGGIEAKVPAYGFLFFAMALAMRRRWGPSWICLGLSAAFHVLVGGWSILIALALRIWDRELRFSVSEAWALASGLLLAFVFGVLPALQMNSGADAQTNALAAEIYVRLRLSHHLYFWDFTSWQILRFALLIMALREVSGVTSDAATRFVSRFAWLAVCLDGLGFILSCLADWPPASPMANQLLRYYWFRLADFAVPWAVALLAVQAIRLRRRQPGSDAEKSAARRLPWVVAVSVVTLGLTLVGIHLVDHVRSPRPGADQQSLPNYPESAKRTADTQRNWRRVCDWIRQNTPRDAIFLTPRMQQTFKWYAQRSEVVAWKDIPQNSSDILEWARRMTDFFGPSWSNDTSWLQDRITIQALMEEYRFDFVVLEQRQLVWLDLNALIEFLEQVYPEDQTQRATYTVWRVRRPAEMPLDTSGGPATD